MDYGTTSNRNTGNIPCIRSNDCKILLGGASEENCCLFCKHVETELKTKVKLTDKTVDQELHPNTPLCTVSKDKLIKELKSSRKKERKRIKENSKKLRRRHSEKWCLPETRHTKTFQILFLELKMNYLKIHLKNCSGKNRKNLLNKILKQLGGTR